jgi:hypothetical protein
LFFLCHDLVSQRIGVRREVTSVHTTNWLYFSHILVV